MTPEERKALFASVVGVVRGSTALAAKDIDFYKSLDKDVAESMSGVTSDIVSMINSVLSSIDEHCEPLENDKESFSNSWNDISNVIDNLFEKSDRSLDILNRRLHAEQDGGANNTNGPNMQYLDQFGGNQEGGNTKIEKPQLNFKTPVDNSETHPFHPLLKEKPNALVPLDESVILTPATENEPEHYLQPYEYEIDHEEYNENILKVAEPIPSISWEDSQATWIDNVESLKEMITELKQFQEIAIDLEHHDYRSYYGIVCLMQISTREKDYIVDTITLRDDLYILNEIFTDPKVTKVLHGAFMDIIWLQRDLGLYVVSLFDTFHASRAVGLPKHSLAYLLEKYAHFKTSKKYQLADWRVRPLSKAMTAYARADTHFLLNIFDKLRNELISSNKLSGVLMESRNVAKRRFEYSSFRPKQFSKTVYSNITDQKPWKSLMFKYNIPMDKELLVKELYNWRELIARRDDESPRYIMPNQIIASLAAYTPVDALGVVSVNNMVTDHVRSNSKILANMIKDCLVTMKEQNKNGGITDSNETVSQVKDITNSHDINYINKVPTAQIESMNNIFGELIGNYNFVSSNGNENKSNGISTNSNYFGELSNDKIIKYGNEKDNGVKTEVTNEELENRELEYKRQLQLLEDIDLEIPVLNETTDKFQLETEIATENTNEISIENMEEKLAPTEDLDEVIVLRKVKRDNNNQKGPKPSSEDSTTTAIDYSKNSKILSNDNKRKRTKNNKRKFDPFSSIEEGVKGMKKRKSGTRGKNVSFKR